MTTNCNTYLLMLQNIISTIGVWEETGVVTQLFKASMTENVSMKTEMNQANVLFYDDILILNGQYLYRRIKWQLSTNKLFLQDSIHISSSSVMTPYHSTNANYISILSFNKIKSCSVRQSNYWFVIIERINLTNYIYREKDEDIWK